jgi:hypothetical protein
MASHRLRQPFVDFKRAGMRAWGALLCAACDYRLVNQGEIAPCPACGCVLWEQAARQMKAA